MPQPKKGARLGSGPKHQRQMLSNLASSLFEHERLKTTEAKAKMLRPFAEHLITKAKDGSIHKRRQVLSVIEDRELVHKLFSDIGPRFADRSGGYTRILKLGPRNGDGAPMALIELVEQGAVARVSDADDEATGTKRRRLSRPTRRRATPQDKPVQSKAAEAAAAGTPGDAGVVEAPDEVVEDITAATEEAAEASAEAATDAAEQAEDAAAPGAEGGAGGVPEGGLPEDKSDTT